MRAVKHWNVAYLVNRLGVKAYERRNPDHPWLTPMMIGILDSWLKPTDVGLEFGSGRSTRWFARRVSRLTSVEHDPHWYEVVREQLRGMTNVDYQLHTDGASEAATSGYVKAAADIPPGSLDFCLIDGAARDHCALASLDGLKSGGILIIDNVNWFLPHGTEPRSPASRTPEEGPASPTWARVAEAVKDWRSIWTSNGVTDTALWLKP